MGSVLVFVVVSEHIFLILKISKNIPFVAPEEVVDSGFQQPGSASIQSAADCPRSVDLPLQNILNSFIFNQTQQLSHFFNVIIFDYFTA